MPAARSITESFRAMSRLRSCLADERAVGQPGAGAARPGAAVARVEEDHQRGGVDGVGEGARTRATSIWRTLAPVAAEVADGADRYGPSGAPAPSQADG